MGACSRRITLAEAIDEVDASAAPDYFLVNCAHPSHIEPQCPSRANQPPDRRHRRQRFAVSHADLDEAIARGDGTPSEFAAAQRELMSRLPHLSIRGAAADPRSDTSQP